MPFAALWRCSRLRVALAAGLIIAESIRGTRRASGCNTARRVKDIGSTAQFQAMNAHGAIPAAAHPWAFLLADLARFDGRHRYEGGRGIKPSTLRK
jgi:hypothetical protein